MKLICYTLGMPGPDIRAGQLNRQWMDETGQRFAYRCLPLNIANQHGWEILSPSSFEATWDGGVGTDAIVIAPLDEGWPPPTSHFGYGVLTFHVNCLFRTEPESQLFVTGPFNQPKDAIQALSGVIETDWSHYTFTMNWKFTRPFTPIRFEKGEPIAVIFPTSLPMLEAVEPDVRDLKTDAPDIHEAYLAWQAGRNSFNEGLQKNDPKYVEEGWQRGYFRGIGPDGKPIEDHRTKVRLKDFPAPPAPPPTKRWTLR
jgi:hypothetical protein